MLKVETLRDTLFKPILNKCRNLSKKDLKEFEIASKIAKEYSEECIVNNLRPTYSGDNLQDPITHGGYSSIHVDPQDSNVVIKKASGGNYPNDVREVVLLNEINHPNIVKPLKSKFIEGKWHIHMVKYETDLHDYVRQISQISIKSFQKIITGINNGILYLHNNKIIHCDLKTANILLGYDGHSLDKPFICDFNISNWLGENPNRPLSTAIQTCSYRCPEIDVTQNYSCYGTSVDIWSFGCIIFELLAGTRLNHSDNDDTSVSWCALLNIHPSKNRSKRLAALKRAWPESFKGMLYQKFIAYDIQSRLDIEDNTTFEYVAHYLINLMVDCLNPDPINRITARSIQKSLQSTFNDITKCDVSPMRCVSSSRIYSSHCTLELTREEFKLLKGVIYPPVALNNLFTASASKARERSISRCMERGQLNIPNLRDIRLACIYLLVVCVYDQEIGHAIGKLCDLETIKFLATTIVSDLDFNLNIL